MRACCRAPQEHLHAWLRSLDAEAEGLPARVRRAAAARAGPLRRRRAWTARRRSRRPATGCSSPAARAATPARRSSRSSTVGWSRPTSWPATSATTSARRSTGWPPRSRAATRSSPISRARCASATSTSRVIRAARERVYARDGGAPRRAGRRPAARPTATSGWPRSSIARSRWPRCSRPHAAASARRVARRAARGHGAPLLPHAHARAVLRGERARRPARSCSADYALDGTHQHLAAAYVELDGRRPPPRRVRRAGPRRCRPASSPSLDLYAQHDGRRRRPTSSPATARDCAAERSRCRQRCTGSSSRSPSPRAAAACRPSTCSRSGPDPRAWSRTRCSAACTR